MKLLYHHRRNDVGGHEVGHVVGSEVADGVEGVARVPRCQINRMWSRLYSNICMWAIRRFFTPDEILNNSY